MKVLSIFLFSLFLFTACSVSENATTRDSVQLYEPFEVPHVDSAISLIEHIRRLPGIYVEQRGGQVNIYIKGGYSFAAENRVLFVVNDIPIGNEFNGIDNFVDVNDIKNITLMRSFQASQIYGMRGAFGAIIFETK